MARYIDEAELVKAIIRERDKIPLKTPCATYELLDEKPSLIGEAMRGGIRKALRCISEAPTADVVEVKHGEWKKEGCGILVCNRCDFEYDHSGMPDEGLNYCPCCGSIMDGTPKESEVQGE